MLEYLLLLVCLFRAVFCSRTNLVAENLLLRQQLTVLSRPIRTRPRLHFRDKLSGLVIRALRRDWREYLVPARPNTVVRWHRETWKLLWRWRSCGWLGRPRLQCRTAGANRQTGAGEPIVGERVNPGELLKFGISVSNRSNQRYRQRGPARPPSQTWRTFLANHQPDSWAADLFTIPTLACGRCTSWSSSPTPDSSWCMSTSWRTQPPHGCGGSSGKQRRGVISCGTCCGVGTPPLAATSCSRLGA
jgi:putative transposase